MQSLKPERALWRPWWLMKYFVIVLLLSLWWYTLKYNCRYPEETFTCKTQLKNEQPNTVRMQYTVFVQNFIESAEKFFMIGHKVNYYVFTDRVSDIPNMTLNKDRNLTILKVPSYPRWQDVSMRRMEMIRDFAREKIASEDFLVCVDVDMKFNDEVGVEILSDLFGTLNPWMFGLPHEQYTYERNPQSEAYIPTDEGDFYYAGTFFGGSVEKVYKLTNFCHNAMMTDKAKNLEPVWHDESYLNKYLLYHKPTKILSPEYLWYDDLGIPAFLKRRRFLAVRKNYNEIRNR
ncbi:histo-blood group ABO system transferase-like isoform X2 [Pyxicephalus adspersus]|uniref:histo-blood group ABO system transferase-like isoform X2 n=1 Tax=Pyxicephalus adspersus TaxID=30357 RepID=UPI003B598634